MDFFKHLPHFDFVGNRIRNFTVGAVLMLASLGLLATRGLNWGIDFTGGSMVQITYDQPVELATLRADLAKAGFDDALPQHFTGTKTFSIRRKGSDAAAASDVADLVAKLKEAAPERAFTVDLREYVGPTVGRHLYKQAIFAVAFSLLGIVGYVAFRFSNPLWGLAAIAALGHDVLVTLGLWSLMGLEVDLTLIAAIMTIGGYSINDTIVIFDRLREMLRIMRRESFAQIVNAGVNETLSRTLITSGLVFMTTLSLLIFGGPVLYPFALTMVFGVIIGSYSTFAIAVPALYLWVGGSQAPAAAAGSIDEGDVVGAVHGKRDRKKRRMG